MPALVFGPDSGGCDQRSRCQGVSHAMTPAACSAWRAAGKAPCKTALMQMPGKSSCSRGSCRLTSEMRQTLPPGCSPASHAQPLWSVALSSSSGVSTLPGTCQRTPLFHPSHLQPHSHLLLLLLSLLQQPPSPAQLLTRQQRLVVRYGVPCRTQPCTGLTASLPGALLMVHIWLGGSSCACQRGQRCWMRSAALCAQRQAGGATCSP
jgi:hypothetical protein